VVREGEAVWRGRIARQRRTIQILVETVEKKREQLLRVVLLVA
jgi:hypothetical protein